jgi:hypothetical protein
VPSFIFHQGVIFIIHSLTPTDIIKSFGKHTWFTYCKPYRTGQSVYVFDFLYRVVVMSVPQLLVVDAVAEVVARECATRYPQSPD